MGDSPYRRSASRPETERAPVRAPRQVEQVEGGRGSGWQVDVKIDASVERAGETTRGRSVAAVELVGAVLVAAFVAALICLGVNARTTGPAAASVPGEPTVHPAALDASVKVTSDAPHE